MFRSLFLSVLSLFAVAVATNLFAAEDKQAEQPLKVTVKTATTKVAPEKEFTVVFRVENVTSVTQTFEVMCCSYEDQWMTDYPKVLILIKDCSKNCPMPVTLEPGKVYTEDLKLRLAADVPPGLVAFRLGFTPIGSKTTYWTEARLELEAVKGE